MLALNQFYAMLPKSLSVCQRITTNRYRNFLKTLINVSEAPKANGKWMGTISGASRFAPEIFFYCAPTFLQCPSSLEGALRTPGGTKMCSYSSLQHISKPFRRQCC